MRWLAVILLSLFIISCNRSQKEVYKSRVQEFNRFKPYQIQPGYSVLDTGIYTDGVEEGKFAVVAHYKKVVDTIDAEFGLQKIGKLLIYQQLAGLGHNKNRENDTLKIGIGNYLLLNPKGDKTILNTIATGFDNYFSSPAVINGKLYYWHLFKKEPDEPFQISAAQYDVQTLKTVSVPLFNHGKGADFSGYFAPPYLSGEQIEFYYNGESVWRFSKTFKRIN